MPCYIVIPSASNALKSITICSLFHAEFSSTYHNDKRGVFIFIFGEYIKPYIKEIDNPALIQECTLNQDTAVLKINLTLKKDFRQRRNKLIVAISNNYGQELLLKTCNGFISRYYVAYRR